jgi:hypothetical protein
MSARNKKSVMHMTDKPITKPHSFLITHSFNFRHNSNCIRTDVQEFSYCPRCPKKHHFVVLIAAKIFEGNFLINDLCHQVFRQLEHDFFLTDFCELKCHGFELSSLIWKLYFQMDMCQEINSKIFFNMICMSLFSHNNHK